MEENTMKKFAKITAVALVVVMALAALVACAPNSDPDKAVEALKKNEYAAAKDIVLAGILKALGINGLEAVVKGTKTVKDGDNNKLETVTIVYFTDSAAAKDAWEKVKNYAEDNKESDSDWTVKQSGAMIYWGTKAAINAAH